MRIIVRVEPKSKEIKKTCGSCKSRLAYLPSDVKGDFRDGDYVICPVCKQYINVT